MKNIYRQDQKAFYKSSWFCTIALKDKNGQSITLSHGDKLIFGVKLTYDGRYLVKKILTEESEIDGVYPIKVSTEEMTMLPGRYYYDISVQTENGDFIKIVPPSHFTVYKSYTEKEVD